MKLMGKNIDIGEITFQDKVNGEQSFVISKTKDLEEVKKLFKTAKNNDVFIFKPFVYDHTLSKVKEHVEKLEVETYKKQELNKDIFKGKKGFTKRSRFDYLMDKFSEENFKSEFKSGYFPYRIEISINASNFFEKGDDEIEKYFGKKYFSGSGMGFGMRALSLLFPISKKEDFLVAIQKVKDLIEQEKEEVKDLPKLKMLSISLPYVGVGMCGEYEHVLECAKNKQKMLKGVEKVEKILNEQQLSDELDSEIKKSALKNKSSLKM